MNNNLHKRAVEMRSEITNVKYELTGSELIALLLESSEELLADESSAASATVTLLVAAGSLAPAARTPKV